MAKREYKDSEGNVVTLYTLVQIEPEWAASIIRWYEGKLKTLTHELEQTVEALEAANSTCDRAADRMIELTKERDGYASKLDSAENAMREVVSHLQHSQRGSTHWAGCSDVHPVCKAIDMLVDALPLRDVERQE